MVKIKIAQLNWLKFINGFNIRVYSAGQRLVTDYLPVMSADNIGPDKDILFAYFFFFLPIDLNMCFGFFQVPTTYVLDEK